MSKKLKFVSIGAGLALTAGQFWYLSELGGKVASVTARDKVQTLRANTHEFILKMHEDALIGTWKDLSACKCFKPTGKE